MIILHTSDWHLGHALHGQKRYEEQGRFLDWLADVIQGEKVDALLVAGDVFDSATPSTRAQALYYEFLCRIASSSCRHAVVVGGNHDSPSFLNAPRELLRALNVHVVGSATERPEDEVLVLRDGAGAARMIVCAVPFLRDRDVRVSESGESIEDKDRKLLEGIRAHYAEVVAAARKHQGALLQSTGIRPPIVATGHLFTAGGRTEEGDGVRELYVGSIAHVESGAFPTGIDYLALGHLHAAQSVGGSGTMRYSGSPLAMGFGDVSREKQVVIVKFAASTADPRETTPVLGSINVPVFQKLASVHGDWAHIAEQLGTLGGSGERLWVEVVYDGADVAGSLREQVENAVAGTRLTVLRIKNNRIMERALNRQQEETLDDLDVHQVFERCLTAHDVVEPQRSALAETYREAVHGVTCPDEPAG